MLPDGILEPIDGDNPAGANLRYDPVYDQIKEARRREDDVPQGEWQRDIKSADHGAVVKLATDALTSRSKDLWLAAWLTEALLHREGFTGLTDGLTLIRELLERYWDSAYPEIDEDGDLDFRASPLRWLAGEDPERATARYLATDVRAQPLNRHGHALYEYLDARRFGLEDVAAQDDQKRKLREDAIAAGRPTLEEWEQGFADTKKDWYKALVAGLNGSMEALEALEALCDERFAELPSDEPLNFLYLRQAVAEVQKEAGKLLAEKLKADPDPPEAEPVVVSAPGEGGDEASGSGGEGPAASSGGARAAPGGLSPEPTSRDDAANRVAAAARFLRSEAPTDPAAYLLVRGLRWGELRAGGAEVDPRLLEAPPTSVRTKLKGLLLDGKWPELLQQAEEVMASPYGRGWLDLQRYVLTATDGLGPEYEMVSGSIRGALRGLLRDLPRLPEHTLMDDSPSANRETRLWLREEGLFADFSEDAEVELEEGAGEGAGRRPTRDAWERAAEKVRNGQPRKAIELLMQEVTREKSERARFLRLSQVAKVMVDAGMEDVAKPILQEMLGQIDRHQLEEWEAGDTIARPLGLLYRCLDRLDEDGQSKQELYLRVCRLDPLQAIHFSAGAGGQAPPNGGAEAEEEHGDEGV